MRDVTKGITNREQRAVIRKAIQAGCTVTLTGSNHIRVRTPSGQVYFCSLTSGDRYVHRRIESALKNMGVDL
jgi:hypothetical protein